MDIWGHHKNRFQKPYELDPIEPQSVPTFIEIHNRHPCHCYAKTDTIKDLCIQSQGTTPRQMDRALPHAIRHVQRLRGGSGGSPHLPLCTDRQDIRKCNKTLGCPNGCLFNGTICPLPAFSMAGKATAQSHCVESVSADFRRIQGRGTHHRLRGDKLLSGCRGGGKVATAPAQTVVQGRSKQGIDDTIFVDLRRTHSSHLRRCLL